MEHASSPRYSWRGPWIAGIVTHAAINAAIAAWLLWFRHGLEGAFFGPLREAIEGLIVVSVWAVPVATILGAWFLWRIGEEALILGILFLCAVVFADILLFAGDLFPIG